MKVAVTVWEDRISPVFDASRHLLIAEIENARVTRRSFVLFNPERPSHLAKTLTELEVPVLICGAVSQVPANMIVAGGITMIPFIAGEVERVLDVYAKGDSLRRRLSCPDATDASRWLASRPIDHQLYLNIQGATIDPTTTRHAGQSQLVGVVGRN